MATTTKTYTEVCSQCEEEYLCSKYGWDFTGMCPECEADFDPTEDQLNAYNNRGGWEPQPDTLISMVGR